MFQISCVDNNYSVAVVVANLDSGQTLVLSSSSPSKMSLQGHHVHSLLDVVDSLASVQSRSPLARLRVRKVQWQECQKCAHSDHSSDEV